MIIRTQRIKHKKVLVKQYDVSGRHTENVLHNQVILVTSWSFLLIPLYYSEGIMLSELTQQALQRPTFQQSGEPPVH